MATEVQDDYLDCGAYQAHTGNKSAANPGFITFEESNGDHFFAWVNGDEIVMRSEAYPDAEKRDRGIKAILKNCDLPERYAVAQEDGKYLLLMYGGGDHQAHTGNRENHSEIGHLLVLQHNAQVNHNFLKLPLYLYLFYLHRGMLRFALLFHLHLPMQKNDRHCFLQKL